MYRSNIAQLAIWPIKEFACGIKISLDGRSDLLDHAVLCIARRGFGLTRVSVRNLHWLVSCEQNVRFAGFTIHVMCSSNPRAGEEKRCQEFSLALVKSARMFKKVVQQGRSERTAEAYCF